MTNKIKLITQPDHILDQAESILIVCPKDDLKKQLETYVVEQDCPFNIYIYTATDNNIRWMLTTANMVDHIIVDVDNCPADVSHFTSYLLSFPHTYYRCENKLAPWELLNLNRFYDFPTL